MQNLTPDGQNLVASTAQRYNLSQDAVIHMLVAVNNGGGSMAQFSCPELGGSGQWMRGGMTMVGDMFNYGLKSQVDNLCNDLSNALANMQVFPVVPAGTPGSNQWWPHGLGNPTSSGGQNSTRYAVFPQRLAVQRNGEVTLYDTLDHNIGGVSQQQGGDNSLTFSSQYGNVSVSSLPVISGPGSASAPQTNFATPPVYSQPSTSMNANTPPAAAANAEFAKKDDIFALIEKLSQLRAGGVLTDEEFNSKKSELLSRI